MERGDLTVTAADDAIVGKDYIVIENATLDLTAVGDGLNDAPAFEAAFCAGTPALDRPVMPERADFFYTGDPDDTGGLMLSGLSPDARHTLRLFASRATDEETRITRFTVEGGEEAVSAEVTTTGPDIGEGG